MEIEIQKYPPGYIPPNKSYEFQSSLTNGRRAKVILYGEREFPSGRALATHLKTTPQCIYNWIKLGHTPNGTSLRYK